MLNRYEICNDKLDNYSTCLGTIGACNCSALIALYLRQEYLKLFNLTALRDALYNC